MEMGACSTAITDHDRDTAMESPIFREPGEDNTAEDWSTAATASSDEATRRQQTSRAALIRGDKTRQVLGQTGISRLDYPFPPMCC